MQLEASAHCRGPKLRGRKMAHSPGRHPLDECLKRTKLIPSSVTESCRYRCYRRCCHFHSKSSGIRLARPRLPTPHCQQEPSQLSCSRFACHCARWPTSSIRGFRRQRPEHHAEKARHDPISSWTSSPSRRQAGRWRWPTLAVRNKEDKERSTMGSCTEVSHHVKVAIPTVLNCTVRTLVVHDCLRPGVCLC